MLINGTYHCWYLGSDSNGNTGIGHATSSDLVSWTKDSANPVLTPTGSGWEAQRIGSPDVVEDGGTYYMFYNGRDSNGNDAVLLATSSDPGGDNWTRSSENPVLEPSSSGWDSGNVNQPSLEIDGSGTWHMLFSGNDGSTPPAYAGHATSSDLVNWSKDSSNPILSPSSSGWDSEETFNTDMILVDGDWQVMFRGAPGDHVGRAVGSSLDDLTKSPDNPEIERSGSGWDSSRVSGPSFIEENGELKLLYHGNDSTSSSGIEIGLARATL